MTTLREKTFDKVKLDNIYLDRCGNAVFVTRWDTSPNLSRFTGDNGRIYQVNGSCVDGLDFDLIECLIENDIWSSSEFPLKTCKNLWFPISELKDKYHPKLMIASPTLVNEDHNPEGVSSAYYEDNEGWVAIGWDIYNDEPVRLIVLEEDVTHFMYVEGPYIKDEYHTAVVEKTVSSDSGF